MSFYLLLFSINDSKFTFYSSASTIGKWEQGRFHYEISNCYRPDFQNIPCLVKISIYEERIIMSFQLHSIRPGFRSCPDTFTGSQNWMCFNCTADFAFRNDLGINPTRFRNNSVTPYLTITRTVPCLLLVRQSPLIIRVKVARNSVPYQFWHISRSSSMLIQNFPRSRFPRVLWKRKEIRPFSFRN